MNSLQDFINAFNVRFYTVTSVDGMGWTDEEICDFFNAAQLQLVEELAGVGNLEAISDLVKDGEITNSIGSAAGKKHEINVSTALDDYFYYVDGTVIITKVAADVYNISAKEHPLDKISIKDVSRFIATDDNVTFFKNPKIALGSNTGKKLTIIVDNYTTDLGNLNIRYISKPDDFDALTADITNLNEALHNRIVSLAVEIAVRTMVNTQNSNQ